jgi:hypothetical protein
MPRISEPTPNTAERNPVCGRRCFNGKDLPTSTNRGFFCYAEHKGKYQRQRKLGASNWNLREFPRSANGKPHGLSKIKGLMLLPLPWECSMRPQRKCPKAGNCQNPKMQTSAPMALDIARVEVEGRKTTCLKADTQTQEGKVRRTTPLAKPCWA